MIKQVEALDLGDPEAFLALMEQFRGDHYRLTLQTHKLLLQDSVAIEEGEDHTTCRFGKWRASFKTTNPQFQAMLSDIEQPHHAFHQGVARIKDLVKSGKKAEAQVVFEKEVNPNADRSLAILTALCQQAQTGVELAKKAQSQLLETARAKQRRVEDLLDKLIQDNRDSSAAEVAKGHAAANLASIILLVTSVAGVLFGFLLSGSVAASRRSITAPVATTVAHLERGGSR